MRLPEAYDYAARLHSGQTRKTSRPNEAIPYINHPCAVSLAVDRAGFPMEVVVAAVLHDVVEDTNATLLEIDTRFGAAVASLVADLTDDADRAKLPRAARKASQALHIKSAPAAARAIKLADQTCNLNDLADDPAAWSEGAAAEYVIGAIIVGDACRGVSSSLEAAFDAAAARAKAAVGIAA